MPKNWQTIRAEIRTRDKATCRRCGALLVIGAVDHLIPRRLLRGREVSFRDNLAWLCATRCHGIKTAMIEPDLYRGDVLGFENFLALVATSGPVPSRSLLARAYTRLLALQRAEAQ
jgi:hypothetical protein